MITVLRGSHSNLLTTEQLKSHRIAHISSEKESGLLNDDLEEFYKFTIDQSMVQPMVQPMVETQELRLDEFRCLSFFTKSQQIPNLIS